MNSTERKGRREYLKWYWGYILEDILIQLQKIPSKENKQIIHNELKEYIGIKTLSGMNDKQLKLYINKVLMVCAREKGIFVRSSPEHPELIIDMDLGDLWDIL